MRIIPIALLAIAAACTVAAQQQTNNSPYQFHVGTGASNPSEISNLPVGKIGDDDLLGITVYDSPELTRTVRVSSEGYIRLPMVQQHIQASGLFPVDLEKSITAALVDEKVLVDPIVTVSIVEYRSKPITVVGAVKFPLKFQASGTVTVLDALSQAGGFADNVGSEVIVTRQGTSDSPALSQRIDLRQLISGADPSLNIHLQGGEEVRVPEAGRVFVVGNVKKPGSFFITDGNETSVMKAVALSEGLDDFTGKMAYIYRVEAGGKSRNEIPVELSKIMSRKTPDVALMSDDILYIPTATGLRAGVKAAQVAVTAGVAMGAAALYVYR